MSVSASGHLRLPPEATLDDRGARLIGIPFSLSFLIPRGASRAALFAQRLGEVYLYILTNRERNLVPLEDELRFAEGYVELLRVRFGDAVRLRLDDRYRRTTGRGLEIRDEAGAFTVALPLVRKAAGMERV